EVPPDHHGVADDLGREDPAVHLPGGLGGVVHHRSGERRSEPDRGEKKSSTQCEQAGGGQTCHEELLLDGRRQSTIAVAFRSKVRSAVLRKLTCVSAAMTLVPARSSETGTSTTSGLAAATSWRRAVGAYVVWVTAPSRMLARPTSVRLT